MDETPCCNDMEETLCCNDMEEAPCCNDMEETPCCDLLLDLLWEIREQIYGYCKIEDLINVACCSNAHYKSLVYLLWCYVKVPWHHVELKSLVMSKQLDHFKYTSSLCFTGNKDGFGDDMRASKVSDNIGMIIENCNPSKLTLYSERSFLCIDVVKHLFEAFVNLKDFSVTRIVLTESLIDMTHLHSLVSLVIDDCLINDNDVKELSKLATLKELTLAGESCITEESFLHLGDLIHLKTLKIKDVKNMKSTAFHHLANLVLLEELVLESTKIDDMALDHLCNHLLNVEAINISGSKNLTDQGIRSLTNLNSLTSLIIGESSITDGSFNTITKLHSLRHLDVNSIDLTDHGMCELRNLTALQHLNLQYTKVADPGLSYLPHFLNKLTVINLMSTGVSDEGMLHLSSMTSILKLYISNTKVSDIGLEHISKLQYLKVLKANSTAVTNAGLQHLKKLVHLEKLDTNLSRVTRDALEELLLYPLFKNLRVCGVHYY